MHRVQKDQIRSMLSGKDRRSLGRVAEVINIVRQYSEEVPCLVEFLGDADACLAMRAADALEKISREQAFLLQSEKSKLLTLMASAVQQEVRWHLAVIVPRLHLTDSECGRAAEILQFYLEDRSSIVKTFALQGLADLTNQYASLRPTVIGLIRTILHAGTPAMRARGRKLLRELERQIN